MIDRSFARRGRRERELELVEKEEDGRYGDREMREALLLK
jgi:hypothetical protein